MEKSHMRVIGIACLVVCVISSFVAIERYVANANQVRAMNEVLSSSPLPGEVRMKPATPAATKYGLLIAGLSGIGGVILLVQGYRPGVNQHASPTEETPPASPTEPLPYSTPHEPSRGLTVEVASPPDRKNVVAGLLLENEQIAEVQRESGELVLEIYPRRSGRPWVFCCAEFLAALDEAKQRLAGNT